ncbi:MAG TPA: Hpt domain-containing protein, partial [Solimonas sp.]|nr:Hpt domain-containing protein [Solimonas sp.]
MNARPRPNVAGLHWVRGEIEQSLTRARTLVEQHVENPGDPLPLQQAFVELHQVRGTASMIQCFGVSALAEEMKQSLNDLMQGRVKETEASFSALLGATVQLGDYIDALADGTDDCALILQPAINELRLARGRTVLTEADLFVAQMQSLGLALPVPESDARVDGAAQAQAKKLLAIFQTSLLQWLKSEPDATTALARLGKISEQVSQVAANGALYQLWRTVAACVEAILGHALEDSLELKRLFGRAGAQLKVLAEDGEGAASLQVGDLALHLLFYVGRSRGQGPRVMALRKVFQLHIYLPSAAYVEELRRKIHGPNTTLLSRVSEEIRADFAKVKDAIDLAVRAGGRNALDVNTTRNSLKRISDTLSVLGLTVLQRVVANQSRQLESAEAPDQAMWMDLATSILRVENSLEDALFKQLRKPRDQDRAELEDQIPHSRDLAEGISALYRESLVNLAKLKSQADAYINTGDLGALSDAGRLLEEIGAGFNILGSARAAALVLQLQRYVRHASFAQVRDSKQHADRFADTVAAVEYYVEAVRDGLPQAARILDDMANYVEQLDFSEEPPAAPAPAEPQAGAAEPALADTSADVAAEAIAHALAAAEEAARAAEAAKAPPRAPEPPKAGPEASDVDPEIREIFLEEAAEVLDTLQGELPRWTRDPDDTESLTTIRRGFHTLKGSGRMVGATHIGEFGLAIEGLLNKCLDGTVAVSAQVVATVNEAVAMLQELIDGYRNQLAAPDSLASLIGRAQNLAAGRSEAEQAEPEMVSIFREDAREKLELVTTWLATIAGFKGDVPVDNEVVRAFHTLKGAAHVVSAPAMSELSAALETYLDAARGAGVRLSPLAVDLIRDAARTLAAWVEQAGTPAVLKQSAQPWFARIEEAQAQVPQHAVQATTDRQLAEVFAGEAFELVEKFEETFKAWARAPDNRQAPRDLKLVLHTLMGAALMSGCPAMGNAARALHARMDECISGEVTPDAVAFSVLADMTEGMYQQLDAFREGSLQDDGLLAERARTFAWRGGEAGARPTWQAVARTDMAATPIAGVEPAAPADPAEAPAEAAGHAEGPAGEVDHELVEIFLGEAEELLETMDRATSALEYNPRDMAATSSLKRALHTLKGSARMAGMAGIGEIGHLLESLIEDVERGTVRLDAAIFGRLHNASDGLNYALDDIRRGRIPDVTALLAELQTEMQEQAPAAAEPAPVPEPAPAAGMLEVTTAEHAEAAPEPELTLSAEANEFSIDLSGEALALPEAPGAEHAAPDVQEAPDAAEQTPAEPLPESAPEAQDQAMEAASHDEPQWTTEAQSAVEDPESWATPATTPEPEAPALSQTSSWRREEMPAAAQILTQPAPRPAVVPQALPEDFDPELAQIFSGEAGELLEALTAALNLWQAQPSHLEPARDMQRSLHTLKGGARMAGLNAMGSAAHEMETRINSIELGRGRADAEAFRHLQTELERLHQMHDLLERGDLASLTSADSFHLGPAPESVTAEAAAPEPVAEAPIELPPLEAPAAPQASAWDPLLFWLPDDQEAAAAAAARRETARVQVESLDKMLNEAGEISIYRSRLEEHNTGFQSQLTEMAQAITRIRDQLRNMEVETEAQIAARGIASGAGEHRYEGQFDPLEMDRYTRMQELSRALSESIGDLAGLHATMDEIASEAETLLLQQGRVNTEVQTGLMRTLMVPFSRQVARLQRVVKQVAQENGKQAEAVFSGIESELDRNVLERMTAPLEHLLRNSVVHGIEDPESRVQAGKPAMGRVAVNLYREGAQLFIELRDDGKGLDFNAIRETAIRRGLMPADAVLKDDDVAQFIFEPGFSTAKKLTQDAGRGIGMDVVASEVKQLGGTLDLGSEAGKGARFLIRLPLTLALSQALLVGVGPEQYAIPLPSIEGIARLPRDQLDNYYSEDGPMFGYGGHEYRVRYLGDFIGVQRDQASESKSVSAILVRIGEGLGATERRVAVVVDGLFGNREIVSKAVGPQVSSLAGVTGATILADGRVVLILDIGALAADRTRRALLTMAHGKAEAKKSGEDQRDLIMVVDDSITIRRVTERLLLKNGFRVVTAKDGLDAMAQLQTESPKAILLDIEMPKADGFEVATFIRNSERIRETPIIMITSRSGEKHRERARGIGVNRYMIKPFQEENLV